MLKSLHSKHNDVFLALLRDSRQAVPLRQAGLALRHGHAQATISNVERGDPLTLVTQDIALTCMDCPMSAQGTRYESLSIREGHVPQLQGHQPQRRDPRHLRRTQAQAASRLSTTAE